MYIPTLDMIKAYVFINNIKEGNLYWTSES